MLYIIIAWVVIGLGVQLWWTVGWFIRKLDGKSYIEDCMSNFWSAVVFWIGFIITSAINIVIWPIALAIDIKLIKSLDWDEF